MVNELFVHDGILRRKERPWAHVVIAAGEGGALDTMHARSRMHEHRYRRIPPVGGSAAPTHARGELSGSFPPRRQGHGTTPCVCGIVQHRPCMISNNFQSGLDYSGAPKVLRTPVPATGWWHLRSGPRRCSCPNTQDPHGFESTSRSKQH